MLQINRPSPDPQLDYTLVSSSDPLGAKLSLCAGRGTYFIRLVLQDIRAGENCTPHCSLLRKSVSKHWLDFMRGHGIVMKSIEVEMQKMLEQLRLS